jgi:hypothetical protein
VVLGWSKVLILSALVMAAILGGVYGVVVYALYDIEGNRQSTSIAGRVCHANTAARRRDSI